MEAWVYDLVRAAHLAWLVVSIEQPLAGMELVTDLLGKKAIELAPVGTRESMATRPGWQLKRALLVVTGMDRQGADDDLAALAELVNAPWPIVPVSTVTGAGFETLGRQTFEALGIVRIYTKEPGKDADRARPFTLPRGATVGDLARHIHKELAEGFKFARVWGPNVFDGQSVKDAHVLDEGDVVEIHW